MDKVPYRLLEEVPELGYGDRDTGNMLIQGDNLDALKALLPFYAGQVKCIYIDPPFNTGEAFPNYDDNLEHSIWIGMLYPRLELLRNLLSEDGTLVIHLDDNEIAYATVLLDEIMGRKNRTYQVTFKQSAPKGHKTINPGLVTISNYILVYAKSKPDWKPNRAFAARPRDKRYSSYIDNYERDMQEWTLISVNNAFIREQGFAKLGDAKKALGAEFDALLDRFVLENAERVVQPVSPDVDQVAKETQDLIALSAKNPTETYRQDREGLLPIILRAGKRWLFYSSKLRLIDGKYTTGEALSNLWDDLLSNNIHNEGGVKFPKGKKPESLIKRVFDLFSSPGDLVLDSFLGSGTTAAAAHKMGRRYIGIEMGEHAETHCQTRLAKVVDGEQGGISQSVNWQGGGGFRFYRLGETVFDETGQIRPDIKFPVLAAHVWFSETRAPWSKPVNLSPVLGIHDGRAYALLYNGILGDKSASGGNVLTRKTLSVIRDALPNGFSGPLTIYGERSALSESSLLREQITFKQTPYDVKAQA
ncbi:site-specific DNA-methyltransferase [Brucella sp. 10RB9215]|uniref:site-specific DNA-methyltransferase n=1 Tax=Brucella sp. 10RB9215 TaxID=1149953 RepID=UPI00155A4A30